MPKVLNKRIDKIPPDAVYVGRPSKWGNPYLMGRDGNREEVVAKYKTLILHPEGSPHIVRLAKKELRGKDLVCWCAPLPCHADVLLKIANTPTQRVTAEALRDKTYRAPKKLNSEESNAHHRE